MCVFVREYVWSVRACVCVRECVRVRVFLVREGACFFSE